ncbi:MAG TPA: histidine kinase, partial [Bacteroidia bacterium]
KAKNEKTIKELSQEKDLLKQQEEINDLQIRFLIIAIVFAIVLIISVILFYRQRALKQQQATLQVEQRLNRSRINPHFFFNALAALQNIMLNGTDKPKLVKNFTAFSKLMRQTLESSYNEFISIEKEIEFLDHYLNLQLLRKEGSFEYKYTIVSELEIEEIMIPAMLLQPFVENAIEHGFKSFTSGGLLLIDFRLNGKNLVITIDDNGAGIKQKKESDDPTHISRATQITKDRLFLINKTLKVESGFKFIDKFEAGTRVELTLPVLYKHELPHH